MLIGVTGGLGTGKTAVAKMFGSLGAEVIDADLISHHLLDSDSKIYLRVIRRFGRDILSKGRIDRKKLGDLVFSNLNYLDYLSEIMHPTIIKMIKGYITKKKGEIIVIDAPLLIEVGLDKLVDVLVVVKTNKKNQIKRIKNKLHLSYSEILKRINTQIPLKNKIKLADFVVDNNGTITETRKQVKRIWERIKS